MNERIRNANEKENQMYSERNLSKRNFDPHKTNLNEWSAVKPEILQWEPGG